MLHRAMARATHKIACSGVQGVEIRVCVLEIRIWGRRVRSQVVGMVSELHFSQHWGVPFWGSQ